MVFTYAPAGLGHLRVADALQLSLPKTFASVVFAPEDKAIESIHRLTSVHLVARNITEWVQRGLPQRIFTYYYRNYLKNHTNGLAKQFINLIKSQKTSPEKIFIVSTHFGLAHQLGSIKLELEQVFKKKIFLVVQVTDDSPQSIWYVDTADLILCPSKQTREGLLAYGRKSHLRPVRIALLPYPVNPDFALKLDSSKRANRLEQYNPESDAKVHIMIPISGAAVGTDFFIHLIDKLHRLSSRLVFHVVCREAPFTKNFLKVMRKKRFVKLYSAREYFQTVKLYNQVYSRYTISAEITKPSEQIFKVLLNSFTLGGVFLFLAEPVGRQEYDNLNFLRRNDFLTKAGDRQRCFLLPKGSHTSAEYIWQQFNDGRLLTKFQKFQRSASLVESTSNGAQLFWQKVISMFG